jgi:hypothetical protein
VKKMSILSKDYGSLASHSLTRTVNDTVERWSEEKPVSHWARTKKQSVHLGSDTGIALERQLEDQRYQMEFNRNPQAHAKLHLDKTRSEIIAGSQGSFSALGAKAKVINKIVREASGVFEYALVPPPKAKRSEPAEDIDPDTHPLMAPYRREMGQAPKIVTFGHRPNSAGRTFHPATMKLRLKTEEVVPLRQGGDKEASNFGLPTAILSTVLKAPKLERPSELEARIKAEDTVKDDETANDLFGGTDSLFDTGSSITGQIGGEALERSRLSSKLKVKKKIPKRAGIPLPKPVCFTESSASVAREKARIRAEAIEKGQPLEKPWNEGFHVIKRHPNEAFQLRKRIHNLQPVPLKERLKRFTVKAASTGIEDDDEGKLGQEKVNTDRMIAKGIKPKIYQRPKEENPYYDEYVSTMIKDLKRDERLQHKAKIAKWKREDYEAEWLAVPDVAYQPEAITTEMKNGAHELLRGVVQRSQLEEFDNPHQTGFRIATESDNAEAFYARKKSEGGQTKPPEFDPGVLFAKQMEKKKRQTMAAGKAAAKEEAALKAKKNLYVPRVTLDNVEIPDEPDDMFEFLTGKKVKELAL